jgi:hypothetical protein
MTEKVFAKGFYVKAPSEKAPEFVKFGMSIKRQEAMEWLQGMPDQWINLQVKEAKSGKWYAEVDTWKPDARKARVDYTPPSSPPQDDYEDDIPF